ncbi:MAG TPA: acyl carrier protein [Gemmatimonadetes bacterium]|nr:acyl carrier protein [Gemmatimonadota bacterium]
MQQWYVIFDSCSFDDPCRRPQLKSYDFLVKLLVDEFGVNPGELVPDASPTGLGLDSLSTMEMVGELEEEFGIKFSTEQVNFTTLGEAAALADELIETQGL